MVLEAKINNKVEDVEELRELIVNKARDEHRFSHQTFHTYYWGLNDKKLLFGEKVEQIINLYKYYLETGNVIINTKWD